MEHGATRINYSCTVLEIMMLRIVATSELSKRYPIDLMWLKLVMHKELVNAKKEIEAGIFVCTYKL
jgi:hypothetical protein